MVQPKYTPEESLQRVKLMMEYNLSKTYTENKTVIQEQANDEYFKTVAESIMNDPSQVKNIDFGNPTINVAQACQSLYKAIDGLGTTTSGISYIVDSAFKTIADTIAIIKKYPEVGGESLYDALEGEWFIGSTKNKVIGKIASQMQSWCQTKTNIGICTPKTADELKWGKF